MSKTEKRCFLFYMLFFLLFSLVMYFCPHTVDDAYYDYLNLSNPYKMLHFAAGYGNGRVLGNLLAVILCKSQLLSAVVRGGTVSTLIYFVVRLIDDSKKHAEILMASVALLIVGMGGLIFGEVFAWLSAFSNYIPPILLTLVCLCLIKERPDVSSIKDINSRSLLTVTELLLFGGCAQLFTENSTLNAVVLSVVILLYCLVKEKGKILYSFAYMCSAGVGTLVMLFARKFIHDKDGIYSTVDYSSKIASISDMLSNMNDVYGKFVVWLPRFFLLYLMLSIAFLIIIHKNKKLLPRSKKAFLTFSLCAYPGYSVLSCVIANGNFANDKMHSLYTLITTLLFLIYIVALLMCSSLLDKNKKTAFCFLVIFALFASGYFLVLYPVNPRCIFYSYILFVLAFCIACECAMSYVSNSEKIITKAVCFGVAGMFAFLIPLYANITVMNKQMNEYVEYQVEQGKKEVYVCLLTNTEYFHHSYASARLGYTYYIKKPNDVNFILIEHGSWLKYCYREGNYQLSEGE